MQVVEQTANRLKFQRISVSALISFVVMGSVGITSFYFALNSFFRPYTSSLTCNRLESTNGNCKLTTASLVWSESKEIPLKELQGAKIAISESTNSDKGITSNNYSSIILTPSGEIPLSLSKSDDSKKIKELVLKINSFIINTEEKYLKAEQHEWSLITKILVGFLTSLTAAYSLLFCIFVLRKSAYYIYTFDKNLSSFIIQRKGLAKKEVTVTQHQLQQITQVRVEEVDNCYRINILMSNGERLSITDNFNSGLENKQEIASRIRKFLNP
jgi:hypothetical protein